MTTWSFVLNSFRFYARSHVGTLLGVAVGAMVLVGAMLVGESVRGSLRDMAAARLGQVQLALLSGDRLFRADLAKRLADDLHTATAATLQLPGVAKRPDDKWRANNVVVMGVDAAFWKLALESPNFTDIPKGAVVLNERLARQLRVEKGDVVNLNVHNPSQLSRDAPMAPIEDATASMGQLNVHAVVTDRQFGRFSLHASQIPPHTAFVPLGQLQSEIDKPSMANLMLVAGATVDDAQAALAKHWQLADAQAELLELPDGNGIELRTPRIFLEPPLAKAARAVAPESKPVLTYFVNKIQLGDKSIPYSMVAALDGFAPSKIWLNQWAGDDLQAKVDDKVELSFYTVGTTRQLEERTAKFTVGGVIAMDDLRADRTLMPEFPGMTDSENCADWDTGLPMDLDAIRDKDEDYWDEFKGTPKAFISLASGQEIWSNRFGDLTAVRFATTDKAALARALLGKLTPADTGLAFRDIRTQADESVSNSMDFGGLFMGFSFFLIASAVMLISLLFQFTMEKRTRETGTLLALGIPAKRVRRMLLLEGGLIALAGCAIGGIAGAAYAQAMLTGLTTNWKDAVASAALTYHSSGTSWAIGLLSAFVIAVGTIWWSLRKLNKQTARELLAGESAENTHTHKSTKRATVIGSLLAVGAAAVVAGALAGGTKLTPNSFYGAGAMLLLAGLAFASARLTRLAKAGALGQEDRLSLAGLGQRNAARRRRRSMATIGMLACGSFMIASIGVFQKDATIDANEPISGTGGFALMGEAAIAVVHDMNDAQQRTDQYSIDEKLMGGVGFVPFRLHDGDHANCLNLNRAQQPRLLGAKPEQLKGRFTFAATLDGLDPSDNPWALLETARESLGLGDDIVPAIADQSVMMWALGMKMLGDTIDYTDEHGNAFKVIFVGQLVDSILQGSLLIAESDFIRRFPSESGYRVFLVDAPAGKTDAVSSELSAALANHGFECVRATQRLGELNAVQNTYLNTFQVLGGLGLLLGSLGLGVVVMRNVQERKSELALLRAIGFEKRTIKRFVLGEYLGLLIGGLLIGTVSAGLAVLPTVLSPTTDVPYTLLGATLGSVLLLAGLWTWIATSLSLRGNLLEGFRGD
jgi:putative ABC transport system permease protein